MRKFKFLLLAVCLCFPVAASADASSVPGGANWYVHIDLAQMREGGPGSPLYNWLREEVLSEIKVDSGIDIEKEIDRVTSYSAGDDAVLIVDGPISQQTRDIVMAFIASGGDISPLKSRGKTYYHFGGNDDLDEDVTYDAGNIGVSIEAFAEQSYISMDLKNKIIVTSTESHMQTLLANKGRAESGRRSNGALMVLTAEKTLLQAGMQGSIAGDQDWDSRILKNTEQVAFLMSAASDMLALEAKLITTEPEMAESLASVVRGVISLMSFSDDMDAEAVAMIQGTRVKAKGNSLSLSLALDPELVVRTLSE